MVKRNRTSPVAPTTGDAGVYRCTECGNGQNLTAYANAVVRGPLDADGSISTFDWEEVWEVHEDSIQCGKHPDPDLEKMIDGQWCRWRTCSICHGSNRAHCPDDGFTAAGSGKYAWLVHRGWWPVGELVPQAAAEQLGHVAFLEDGQLYCCRRCGLPISSIAAREPCQGEKWQSKMWPSG